VTALAARRRHPLATAVLVLLGLIMTGVAYAAIIPTQADAAQTVTADQAQGRKLFLANCSTCHGLNAEGQNNAPSLIGVGAAAVDFQVGTGRMPLAANGPQAPKTQPELNDEETAQLAAYIASLAPGPAIPSEEAVSTEGGVAGDGATVFRVNCAMCHGAGGKGGALTRGKYAPDLTGVSGKYIYEAMATGPQSMPVFNDNTIDPQSKKDIITYLNSINEAPNVGGLSLGRLGPVSEGLVAWVVGLTALVGCAVWLGSKAA
jgi:ubiquinol-cytochrome c reductase cytochrome c subunit